MSSYCEWIPSYFLMWVDVGRTSLHSPRFTLLNYQINGSVYKHYSKTVTWLSPIHKEWFNSYAPELVPMFHYRDKTRVQMFYFLNLNLRFNTVSREELQRREIICIYYDHSLLLYLSLLKTKHFSIIITTFNVRLSRSIVHVLESLYFTFTKYQTTSSIYKMATL